MRNKFLLFTITTLAAIISVPAQALYMYDLTVTGFWSGSGSIDFNALTGNTTAGVDDFMFHVSSGAGSPRDYGLGDIASVEWTIDSQTFDLTSIVLTSNLIAFGLSDESAILLNNTSTAMNYPCPVLSNISHFGPLTCEQQIVGGNAGGSAFATLSSSLQADVPEPSTVALMGIGLAGLGFTRRKIKMKA